MSITWPQLIEDEWNLVASAVNTLEIKRLKSNISYQITTVDANEAIPADSIALKSPFIFEDSNTFHLTSNCRVDVYLWIKNSNPETEETFDNAIQVDTGKIGSVPLEENGGVPVNIQDQTTRPLALRMNKVIQDNLTLSIDTIVDSRTITMTTGHGLVANDHIIIIEENGEPQFFFAQIISVATDILTLEHMVPHVFTAEHAAVTQYDPDLNKNGATTVYKAELRNPFSFPIDVTRFIFHITDATAMDDGKFGGGVALTYGVSLRKNLSATNNLHYWNVKTNGKFGELAYDKEYDDKAPAGVYGFRCRMSYAGPDKHGVAIRLEQGQAVELLIQDDLSGLSSFAVVAEGHFTESEV